MYQLENLEKRRLLSSVSLVTGSNTTFNVPATSTGGTLDLGNYFGDVATSNSTIHLATTQGPIDLQLLPGVAPQTVTNFINYVNSGEYNGTIFHRSVPGFVIQAGGFDTSGNALHTNAAVQNEFHPTTTVVAANVGIGDTFKITVGSQTISFTATDTSPETVAAGLAAAWNISTITAVQQGPNLLLTPNNGQQQTITTSTVDGSGNGNQTLTATTPEVNTVGTVAMAKLGSDPNSATNQWFINLADNASNLDFQNGGFTVFADVIDNTMTTANAIAGLQTVNAGSPFDQLPVVNFSSSQTQIFASNLVIVEHASAVPNYSVTSDNPGVATASITNSQLVITMGSGSGTTHLVVTATDPNDHSTVQQTLTVSRDGNPPTAAVGSTAPVFASDNSTVTFTVVYTDDNAVSAASLGNDNIQVTGPNGYSQLATLVSTGLTDAGQITATYRVTGPNGSFTTASDGSYTVAVKPGSVTDTAGNGIVAASLGSFTANLAPPAPGPDLTSTISKVTGSTLTPSSKNNLTFAIKNSGTLLAKGKVPVKVMVGNTVVATLSESLNLKPGVSKTFSAKFVSPNLTEGDYQVKLVVDDTNALSEQYTANNNATAGATVHVVPPFVDLKAALGALPSDLKAKGTVSVIVTNNGSIPAKGGSTIKLYAPTTQSVDSGALLVTLPKSLNIAPGKSLTVKIKLPSIIPTGQRYILATIDWSGTDTNTNNNDVFSQSTVLLG